MNDKRLTWGLITDVLDVLETHGFRRADDQHTGRAIGFVFDLARIYEGTQEAPAGAYLVPTPPSPQTASGLTPQTADHAAGTVTPPEPSAGPARIQPERDREAAE